MSQDGDRSRRLEILTASEIDIYLDCPASRKKTGSPVEHEATRAFNFPVAAHFVL